MSLKDEKIRAAQTLLGEALALSDTPSDGARVLTVKAGQDFQSAIDQTRHGQIDAIELEAGATFEGNFLLRGSNAAPIAIRSAGQFWQERITPTTAGAFAKVRAPRGGAPAFATEPGAQGWTLSCLEVPENPQGFNDLIRLGDGSLAQNRLDGIPSRFVLDRLYLHGNPTFGQKRGVALNCLTALITNCYMDDFFVIGQDSQAIDGWNGPGDYTIFNNFLQAAGENVLFGGTDAAVLNLVPTNIGIEGNTIQKKLAWMGKGYNVKTSFELKNARNVTFKRNDVQTCYGDAQVGYAVQLTPRNQDGKAAWSTVEDVLIEDNDFRDIAAAINFLGTDYGYPSGRMKRVHVLKNRFLNVDPVAFKGSGASDKVFQVMDGPEDLTLDGNLVQGKNISSVLYLVGPSKSRRLAWTNNTIPPSTYGADSGVFGGGSSVGGNPPHAFVDYVDEGTIGGNVVTL